MIDATVKRYIEAVFDTDRETALAVIHDALDSGVSPEDIVFRVVIPAVEEMMSEITRDPDANLAQHFMTAQISAEVTDLMLKQFTTPPQCVGTVVIGTAAGDLHSLGKRIVSGCLKALMVNVVDLGVNVPAEKFVEAALENRAEVIAVSAMMVHTASGENGSLKIRKILQERDLEKRFRLIVGGAPYRFDQELYRRVGADSWAPDGVTAGRVILDLIREVQHESA